MIEISPTGIAIVVGISFVICVLATALAMESAALFVPAFLLLFPVIVPGFPTITGNDAIGLTLLIMFFGQTSTLIGYWSRNQIDVGVATSIVVLTVPIAILGRIAGYLVPEDLLLALFVGILYGLALLVSVVHFTTWRPPHRMFGPRRRGAFSGTHAFDGVDRLSFVTGGLIAGMVGFAIGEISNTTLHFRNQLPIKLSTGTSTLVLFITLLAANVTNLAIVFVGPIELSGGVSVPWSVALIVAPVVVVGGQVGAFLNNRLSGETVVVLLIGAYVLVGSATLVRMAI